MNAVQMRVGDTDPRERACPHAPDATGPRGWYTRGYLPHFDTTDHTQMLTWRLADALPIQVAQRLAEESVDRYGDAAYRKRIEGYLDAGHGSCILVRPEAARIVRDALRHFDMDRYLIHAWVIMPNHVHVLVRVLPGHSFGPIVKSWKSFTCRQINKLTESSGSLWQKDCWDRFIRNEAHFARAAEYIHLNPVRAGLAPSVDEWPWSSAGSERW